MRLTAILISSSRSKQLLLYRKRLPTKPTSQGPREPARRSVEAPIMRTSYEGEPVREEIKEILQVQNKSLTE
jgi:hypothetical protein